MQKMNIRATLLLFLLLHTNNAYATERVVLTSIHADKQFENVYVLADKKSWMDWENFTVQIGDRGYLVYNFPHWYHGKYDPTLYSEDVNNDKLKDVIIILNNDRAKITEPSKDIHILNQVQDPYERYEEARIEPINTALQRLVKLEQKDKIITIIADKQKYQINVSTSPFTNPREPYMNIDTAQYSIENGTIIVTVKAYVIRDNNVYGGILGHVRMKYKWDGKMYKVKSVTFKKEKATY